jgi:UDP-2,3-diacylglucosamine hydrolase
MTARTKIYFASDLHLGTPDYETSLRREKLFVQWLDMAGADAAEIFLVGDTFDFWHDYKTVVPKGYVRLLGKLAGLDGLGPKDHGYKFIKKVFTNPVCQWLFRWIHPDLGMRLAAYLSYTSRYSNGKHELEKFHGEDNEWLVQYSKRLLERKPYDYFIFGHRHLPLDIVIKRRGTEDGGSVRYINLGDWLDYNSYAVWDREKLELKYYKGNTEPQ